MNKLPKLFITLWLCLAIVFTSAAPSFTNKAIFAAPAAPSLDVFRLEAENMNLSGYVIEGNKDASKGKLIKNNIDENAYAYAASTFQHPSGKYTLRIFYFDEPDGGSTYKLLVGDRWIDIWKACRDLDHDGAGKSNLVSHTISDVTLNQGDEIRIYGKKDKGEYARLDCIDFIPKTLNTSEPQTPEVSIQKDPTPNMNPVKFVPDEQGFIRNWYTLGPLITPYAGDKKNERQAREEVIKTPLSISSMNNMSFDRVTSAGEPWELYASGRNTFVEKYKFFYTLAASDYYGLTDLVVDEATTVKTRLWYSRGSIELWCNGKRLLQKNQLSGSATAYTDIELELQPGINRIMIRQLDLGARNTPQLFGLQLLDKSPLLQICLPGNQQDIASFFNAEKWLYSVNYNNSGCFEADVPPPSNVVVSAGSKKFTWGQNQTSLSLESWKEDVKPFRYTLTLNLGENILTRTIEIPQYAVQRTSREVPLPEHRQDYAQQLLKYFQSSSAMPAAGLIMKSYFQNYGDGDSTILKQVLKGIDSRADCSDFHLAALLRLYMLDDLSDRDKDLIKKTALNFRYWSDEKGTDAMAMGSENHALLFHGDQLIAGLLFPEDTFTRSGRTGRQQAEVARKRILAWLDKVENFGFEEFLSNAYVPVTMGALLNLVDFSKDVEISNRASRLMDTIFKQLAHHSFDGLTTGPQGRIYRNGTLYPHNEGTQAILSYATPKAVMSFNPWVAFLITSSYRIPADIDMLMDLPLEKLYPQGGAEITLKKTNYYMASSLSLPSPLTDKAYKPGTLGKQEHLWDVVLGKGAHIFVNHPGASFEASESRPGYWNGNGILPTLKQKGNIILEVFDIPQDYPVQVTHAFWPSDQMDQETKEDHWVFGAKNGAYAALWSSNKLERSGDITLGRELRSYGSKTAWICIVSSIEESESFEAFEKKCREINPWFDEKNKALYFGSQVQLVWQGQK